MKAERTNVFERIAAAVTVRDIQRRFAFTWNVDKDGNSEVALLKRYVKVIGVLSDQPVLLKANYSSDTPMVDGEGLPFGAYYPALIFGKVWRDGQLSKDFLNNEDEGDCLDNGVSEGTLEFNINNVVSADTTLIELLDSFANKLDSSPILVLDRGEWSGVICGDDLMAAPARLCLTGLVLELEDVATRLCRLFPTQAFGALSDSRRLMALERCAKQLKDEQKNQSLDLLRLRTDEQLRRFADTDNMESVLAARCIDYTMYIDKASMVRKCNLTLELSNSELGRVFGRAERLRNQCVHSAHGSGTLRGSASKLRDLVKSIHSMIEVLEETYIRECQTRGMGSVNTDSVL